MRWDSWVKVGCGVALVWVEVGNRKMYMLFKTWKVEIGFFGTVESNGAHIYHNQQKGKVYFRCRTGAGIAFELSNRDHVRHFLVTLANPGPI